MIRMISMSSSKYIFWYCNTGILKNVMYSNVHAPTHTNTYRYIISEYILYIYDIYIYVYIAYTFHYICF